MSWGYLKNMSKVTLFLGAGASKAFDYPTTKEFLDNLQEVLSEEEKRVLNSIVKTPEVRDIEHVLQILDPIIEFDSNPFINRMFRRSSVYITLERGNLNWKTFVELCKKLKGDIIGELHRQYEFDRNKLEKIVVCYDRLFKIKQFFSKIRRELSDPSINHSEETNIRGRGDLHVVLIVLLFPLLLDSHSVFVAPYDIL